MFISASAVGVYGDRAEEVLTEDSSPSSDYLSQLCLDWENEAVKSEEYGSEYGSETLSWHGFSTRIHLNRSRDPNSGFYNKNGTQTRDFLYKNINIGNHIRTFEITYLFAYPQMGGIR